MNETIKEVIENLEKAANTLRRNHEAAKASLTPEQLSEYESLSLASCFALLAASEFDNNL